MGLTIALFSIGIVCGVILALHFMGKRPINVNIDARGRSARRIGLYLIWHWKR